MPNMCFSYSADVTAECHEPRGGTAGSAAAPEACRVIRALPTQATSRWGAGTRDAVQPPPESKLCFSYTVTHCFRC